MKILVNDMQTLDSSEYNFLNSGTDAAFLT